MLTAQYDFIVRNKRERRESSNSLLQLSAMLCSSSYTILSLYVKGLEYYQAVVAIFSIMLLNIKSYICMTCIVSVSKFNQNDWHVDAKN